MSRKLFLLISLVLVCVLSGSISQAQENQFYNSEFDEDLDAWGSSLAAILGHGDADPMIVL